MNDTVITVENLSKKYIIGHQVQKGDGLRHAVESVVRAPVSWIKSLRDAHAGRREEFWALKDVSFSIKQGEVVGIIGRNGAGKSTLLKLLSRITEPTTGRIHLRGRVASLLEVGTGFHPELTGRENIYLNGAVLGMSRLEIKRKFDEIVAFSEIEKFLDTPVKRYSSGMYVRLAFAVAAHLEPEILVVDEVLAVGDAEFQKKCIGKMEDVATRQGRTVLFVSHQMPVIQNLCRRCVLLEKGEMALEGPTESVVDKYLARPVQSNGENLESRCDRKGSGNVRITAVYLRDTRGSVVSEAVSGRDYLLCAHFAVKPGLTLKGCRISLTLSKDLHPYFTLGTDLVDKTPLQLSGTGRVEFLVRDWPLSGGLYHLSTYVAGYETTEDWLDDAMSITTIDGDYYRTGRLYHAGWQGRCVLVRHSFEILGDTESEPASVSVSE